MGFRHIPVMPAEVRAYLDCKPGRIYVDGTIGGAGHARAICEAIGPNGLLIGIDQDRDAIENAANVLSPYGTRVRLFCDNFVNLPTILAQQEIAAVDGVLLDLGLSLHQIEKSGRGFSFNRDETLDMRMNINADTTAQKIVNRADAKRLADIFRTYGEERWAKPIARNIVAARKKNPITTSKALADIVVGTIPRNMRRRRRIHPATRVFQALRIAVNKELDVLNDFLKIALNCLNPDGRLCVLAFHSLEDRIVKRHFKALASGCVCPPDFPRCVCGRKPLARILTKKALRPTPAEVDQNPMARSTKMRVIEKLALAPVLDSGSNQGVGRFSLEGK